MRVPRKNDDMQYLVAHLDFQTTQSTLSVDFKKNLCSLKSEIGNPDGLPRKEQKKN